MTSLRMRFNTVGRIWTLAVSAAFIGLLHGSAASSADAPVSYSRDIRPILSNHCYACHGPDEKKREADLRLDVREIAIESAIVPGKADESELLARVTSDDADERMPPASSKKPALTPEQVDLLKRWIDQGANFDRHWAYVTPTRPNVPDVKNGQWPLNPLDRFIAAEHERRGYTPAPEADRRTLIRRLSFDLIGLPPTPEEIDQFVNDDSPGAYERLVDRLLQSKHFGERMAMYWLDVVRYADTNGIHGDNHRDHDLYRDYVIKTFNENKPYDQFTIEQLAGDLFPDATNEQKIASGYNRLNMTTREGGAQAKEYLAKYSADRVRNTSVAFLGSTMGCCECHNHKFDPFTTEDFYSFAAFFADVQETAVGEQKPINLPVFDQTDRTAEIDAEIAKLQKVLDTPTPELDAAQAEWEKTVAAASEKPRWTLLRTTERKSAGGAELALMTDHSILAKGNSPDKDTYSITVQTRLKGITAFRLEVMPYNTLPKQGPGRAGNGNFVLTEFTVEEVDAEGKAHAVELQNPTATFEQKAGGNANPYGFWSIAGAVDADQKGANFGWAIIEEVGKPNNAVFETKEDFGDGEDRTLVFKMHHNYGGQHTIGRFRLAATTDPRPIKALRREGPPDEILDLVAIAPNKRTAEQQQELSAFYRGIAPQLNALRQQIEALEQEKSALASKSMRPILVAMSGNPRTIRVLPRGNWLDDSGPVVEPAAPGFLNPLEVKDRRASRMDLARWIVEPENPLTSRVFVNRLWKLMFGQGLCRSLDDFGAQGTVPSHPELLDWLAVEFIESGWDVKRMLKLMVMSRTYRQSSLATAELRERDPQNIWLARQNRFRLDAEMVRDNALAISGLLVRTISGPSVKPYQPPGYWSHLNFPKREWPNGKGNDLYRRGLYTYWCRTFLHPSLLAFDAPTREESCVQRPRSNTPLQALVLLNDPTYVEAARVFAAQIMREGGGAEKERLDFAYKQALGRPPKPAEVAILSGLLQKHLTQYADDPSAAAEVLKNGDFAAPADLNATELAAWTSVARAILNLHETIARY